MRRFGLMLAVRLVVAAALLGGVTACLRAEETAEDPVKATIVANAEGLSADTPAKVGVLLKLQPSWHVYWKNPGESGYATAIQWSGPEGVTFGETQYPLPIVFDSPGPVKSFGYEKEVLLFADVKLGGTAAKAREVEIVAKAKWLMCSNDQCIPGKAELKIKLPVGEVKPANAAVFDKYGKNVPKAGEVEGLTTSIEKSGKGFKALLKVPAGEGLVAQDKAPGLRGVYFFPEPIKDWSVGIPELSKPDGEGAYTSPVSISVTLEPQGDGGATAPTVSGVLVTQSLKNGKPGEVRAVQLRIAP